MDWIVFACFFPLYCKSTSFSFIFLWCVTCRNLILALFLVLCPCVILSIWSIQVRTSVMASMTKLSQVLSAKFSGSNTLLNFFYVLSLYIRLKWISMLVESIIWNLLFLKACSSLWRHGRGIQYPTSSQCKVC